MPSHRVASQTIGIQTGFGWFVREARQRQLLNLLSVVAGADLRFLMHSTGMSARELGRHVSALGEAGYVSPTAGEADMLSLTEGGRVASDVNGRWRFKSAALVFLSALSRR